jgi:hypothetical protein
MKWKIAAVAALIVGTSPQAFAQGVAPPVPTAQNPDSLAATRANREQQEGFDRLARDGVKINNAEREDDRARLARRKAPVAAAAADLVAGAPVRDKEGVQVATVERLEDDGAVLRTADRLAKLPVNAFGKDDNGLLLGITGAEFQAAIATTSVPVPQQAPQIVDATASDMTPGAAIRDSEGVPIGTVERLAEGGVIILTDGRKVKLAIESFGKDDQGLLIGITASEFKTAIGNSASANPGG